MMMTTISTRQSDRFERQGDLIPQPRLAGLTATVVGVGAIGRQVALQLACVGVPRLQLIDFDVVEPTNVTTQGYAASVIGLSKVVATARDVSSIGSDIAVTVIDDRYRPSSAMGDVLFCCVDSIAVRQAIWKADGSRSRFWCDGRMLGETIRVLTVAGELGRTHYPATLFPAAEAEQGRCTSQATIYAANIAAGLMLHQFSRWLRGLATEPDLMLNLLAGELSSFDPQQIG
jgi:sulfur carrier protein ThiS adenylyltransferase